MGDLLPIVAAVYVLVGLVAAVWSHRHGNHRAEASPVAKVLSALVVGCAWPAMALDLWFVDPDDTRRERRQREER